MSLRAIAILLSILLPLSAAAQRIAPPTLVDAQRPLFDRLLSIELNTGVAGANNQVVPLWASPDGRLMAIVALSRPGGAPTLPPSPTFGGVSDFRVVDATDLFSAGLRLRLVDGLHADMMLAQESGSNISYDLEDVAGCFNCFGGIGSAQNPGVFSAGIGLGWTASAVRGVDLSFGLSWLDGRHSQLPQWVGAPIGSAPISLAPMDLPEIATPYTLSTGHRLSASGSWQLEQGPILDLTAVLTRADLSPVWSGIPGTGLDLSQASLGLGVVSGSIRGSIVGRISTIDEPGIVGSKRWGGLDLGVSWRTPWRGEVTVGAQNLWSAPLDAATARDKDASQARVPYVQYRQDL